MQNQAKTPSTSRSKKRYLGAKLSHLAIKAALLITAFSYGSSAALGKVVAENITYKTSTTSLSGWAYYDTQSTKKRPAVLVVHEWYGLNDYAKERARMLAAEGYIALAVDMYGEGKFATHPKDAKKFMMAATSDPAELKARFEAAMKAVSKVKGFNGKISAIGYCFGGAVVLNMARASLPLEGVVSYHGSLQGELKAELGKVKAEVLVATGGSDPMVPASQVGAFASEMSQAGVTYTLLNYPKAKHGFTNKNATAAGKKYDLPLAYDAEADASSWDHTLKFLNRVFMM